VGLRHRSLEKAPGAVSLAVFHAPKITPQELSAQETNPQNAGNLKKKSENLLTGLYIHGIFVPTVGTIWQEAN
jgi:hypothetical protein